MTVQISRVVHTDTRFSFMYTHADQRATSAAKSFSFKKQNIIESRVKITSRKLSGIAILPENKCMFARDESRAPDLTISGSESPPPEAEFLSA